MDDHTTICACGCNQVVPKAQRSRHQNKYIKGHSPTARRPLTERFWKHVDKRAPDICWAWTGFLNRRGYGQIKLDNGKMQRVHRVAWILAHGPIPDRLHVCHSCDNPHCVNPNHLFLGTHFDNMADKVAKSRQTKMAGTLNGRAKLTPEQVIEIRERFARGGVTNAALAQEYGVNQSHIWRIVNRILWSHI